MRCILPSGVPAASSFAVAVGHCEDEEALALMRRADF
jgi:hypothetical protein